MSPEEQFTASVYENVAQDMGRIFRPEAAEDFRASFPTLEDFAEASTEAIKDFAVRNFGQK